MLSYSSQKEFMDLNDLARFLENEQKVDQAKYREHSARIIIGYLLYSW